LEFAGRRIAGDESGAGARENECEWFLVLRK